MYEDILQWNDSTVTCPAGVLRKLAFGLAFYFYEDAELTRREAVLKILDEYRSLFGPGFRWTTNPDTGKWKSLKNGYAGYVTPDQWLMKAGRGVWEFVYHGAAKAAEASDVEFYANSSGLFRGDRAFAKIYCHFPLDMAGGASALADLAFKWAAWLRPFHGYGGYALATSHGLAFEESAVSGYVDSWYAQHMPGVNLNQFFRHANLLQTEIKGADWLTFLSDHFIGELGGPEAFGTAASAAGLECRLYEGGAMLVAGPAPQKGPGGWSDPALAPYCQAAGLVEPIRKKDHWGYYQKPGPPMPDGRPYLNEAETRAWLARFSPKA